jgi:hypothetical protein
VIAKSSAVTSPSGTSWENFDEFEDTDDSEPYIARSEQGGAIEQQVFSFVNFLFNLDYHFILLTSGFPFFPEKIESN